MNGHRVLVFRGALRKLALMLKCLLWSCAFVAGAAAQTNPTQVELANLHEDVRGLVQRVGELTLRVEQLEHENAELRARGGDADKSYATLTQLNDAITNLNRNLRAAIADSKSETLDQVSRQMEQLAKQTNAALDSIAKGSGAGAARTTSSAGSAATGASGFSNDFPKEGISYTIQKGDTIALIAKKTGAKVQDIINANKLSDPSHIVVGHTLFIPGAK